MLFISDARNRPHPSDWDNQWSWRAPLTRVRLVIFIGIGTKFLLCNGSWLLFERPLVQWLRDWERRMDYCIPAKGTNFSISLGATNEVFDIQTPGHESHLWMSWSFKSMITRSVTLKKFPTNESRSRERAVSISRNDKNNFIRQKAILNDWMRSSWKLGEYLSFRHGARNSLLRRKRFKERNRMRFSVLRGERVPQCRKEVNRLFVCYTYTFAKGCRGKQRGVLL